MKKFAIILLVSIYSLSTLGMSIRQFYCCGKLKSTDITFTEVSKQKCSKGNSMTGCCKFSFTSLKVKDSHVAADGITTPAKYFIDLHLFIPTFEAGILANKSMDIANASHAPPLHYVVPIHILNCVYRI